MLTIILVCPADRLPTGCQQVTDCRPTVGRQSANTLASNITQAVGGQLGNSQPTVGRQSADCCPTVGQQLADCRPTVDRQSADRFFGELFFTITNTAISIPSYSLERMDRNRNGGGVALFTRSSINYENIQALDEKLELLCVKVIKPMAKPFIVGMWYRPPGSPNEIMHAFESALERLEQYDLETNLLGAFNCDIAASPLDHQTVRFLNICTLYQFHQLIHSATRINASTATTIDLFITDNQSKFSHAGVSHIGISDHSLFTPIANYAFQLVSRILFLAGNIKILNPLVLGGSWAWLHGTL